MSVTATSIKLRFPEFAEEQDSFIEFAIEEANRLVDHTWDSTDQDLALSYLTAHYMMVSISRRESATGEIVQSERVGEISVTYATRQQPTLATYDDFSTTPYGSRYLELARLNFPPIAAV